MKILYVILGCRRYFDTRKVLQETAFLKRINIESEYLYLIGDKDKSEPNVMYTDTMDNYDSCPHKYLYFLKNFSRLDEFDWVFFMDDDTYLFPDRLEKLLSSCKDGQTLGLENIVWYNQDLRSNSHCTYPAIAYSGGAGFAASKAVVINLQRFLKDKTADEVPMCGPSDVAFGHWLTRITFSAEDHLNSKLFFPTNLAYNSRHNIDSDLNNAVTFHYCSEIDFSQLEEYLSTQEMSNNEQK